MPGALQNGTKPALFSCHLTSRRCFLIQIRKGPAALSHLGLELWARCTPAASDRKSQLNVSIKTGVSAELANSSKPFTRRKARGCWEEEQLKHGHPIRLPRWGIRK